MVKVSPYKNQTISFQTLLFQCEKHNLIIIQRLHSVACLVLDIYESDSQLEQVEFMLTTKAI